MLVGVASLGPEPDYGRFATWIDAGEHAGMDYLERNRELREDPARLLPGAKSAIIVALPYGQGDALPLRGAAPAPRVAQYARLRDYHKILWREGEALLEALWERLGHRGVGRVLVDSAPILERALAARAGRGFIGKNTCYIDPEEGSFLLLAEIVLDLALEATASPPVNPEARTKAGGCGSCKRCQVHCPTGALDAAYRLDARKCLAYWTIEHRGVIPEEFWFGLGIYLFGCDICQLACPYNRGVPSSVAANAIRVEAAPPLLEVATMDQAAYERLFGGTPMTRAKREGLMRNALIAMAVTDAPQLEAALAQAEAAGAPPVVRETAAQIRARASRAAGVT